MADEPHTAPRDYRIYIEDDWQAGVWDTLEIATQRLGDVGFTVAPEPSGYRLPDPVGDSFILPEYDCYQWWIILKDGEQAGILAKILTPDEVPQAEQDAHENRCREGAKAALAVLEGTTDA